jgi:hypothetical protein
LILTVEFRRVCISTHTTTDSCHRDTHLETHLGPLLFNLFFFDAPDCVSVGTKMTCFADDVLLTASSSSAIEAVSLLSEELKAFNAFCSTNRLSINASKTKWMLVYPDKTDNRLTLCLNDTVIEMVSSFKYLGVLIDAKLTWQNQVDSVISRVKRSMYIIRRSTFYSSLKCSKMLFQSMIVPIFSYCIEVWFTTSATLRGSLELAQRHCARIILKDVGPGPPTISNRNVYEAMNIVPLQLLFQQKASCLIFSILNSNDNSAITNVFRFNPEHAHGNLRVRLPLIEPFIRCERNRAALNYWGTKLWNQLNNSIRDSRNLKEFRERVILYVVAKVHSGKNVIETPRHFYDFV